MEVEQTFSHTSCDWPTGDQVRIITHSHFWLTQHHVLRSLWLKKVVYYKFVRENAWINFKSQGKTIALATIYNPPGNTPNINNFKHILKSHPLAIFMGDYNCKHVFFGCKKANKEGDILFDILEELELLITNDDTPTHRPGTNIADLLDLAIVSRQMAPKIESCEIGQDIGSDHLPVHLTLTSP